MAGTSSEQTVLRALCHPSHGGPHQISLLLCSHQIRVGDLLVLAVEHKVLCLLAHQVTTAATGPAPELPLSRTMLRFLASTVRANQYKTAVYRREADHVFTALDCAGLQAVALNGLALESLIYQGNGERQFSDLDILVTPDDITAACTVLDGLGYQAAHHPGSRPSAVALTRTTNDQLVPRISVDLTGAVAHASDTHTTRLAVRHRCVHTAPGRRTLPVLAAGDALLHALARLGKTQRWYACADALRLYLAANNSDASTWSGLGPARAGWDTLRHIWPDLPVEPLPVRTEEPPLTPAGALP